MEEGAVRACGALALHHGIISDHVGIFVDYDEEKMLKTNTAELLSVASRKLNSKSPKKAENYLKILWKLLRQDKILDLPLLAITLLEITQQAPHVRLTQLVVIVSYFKCSFQS